MSAKACIDCEVCGRSLSLLGDGKVRHHKRPGRRGAYVDYCSGSGHRQVRWTVGQRLRHHAGSLWAVVEDRKDTPHRDYLVRCLDGAKGNDTGDILVAHGEYMHRDGWTPVEVPA